MSLSKEQLIDQITVTNTGTIFYREVTKIMEDGIELSKSYNRTSLVPGQDLSNIPDSVISIAQVVWTDEIVNAYNAKQENPLP